MPICKEKTDGVVIWYNPTPEHVITLRSYLPDIHRLFVVDNSDNDNSAMLTGLDGVTYLPQYQNLGIATAQNIGCQKAIADGAEWILIMDQDSSFVRNSLTDLMDEANRYGKLDTVGIFSPLHDYGKRRKGKPHPRFEDKTDVMASGNLLSAHAYLTAGPFLDEFFIDFVDIEYCLRLREKGFLVLQLNNIVLEHHLGDKLVDVWWLPHKQYATHNALRHYYIFRNSLKTKELYPNYAPFCKRWIRRRLKRLLLYDNDQKLSKLKYAYWGWRDYKKGIFGKFNH